MTTASTLTSVSARSLNINTYWTHKLRYNVNQKCNLDILNELLAKHIAIQQQL